MPVNEKESSLKLCKIKGKNLMKGKINLNLHDGRNIITDNKEIKVGDSVLIELPAQKINQHLN